MKNILLCLLAIIFSLNLGASAIALEPEEARVITPLYKPKLNKFNPPLGTYRFKVSWQGIPAAYANFTLKKEGDHYKLESTARTNSVVDIFYKLRYEANSKIVAKNLMPVESTFNSKENSRYQTAKLKFKENGDIKSFYQKNKNKPKEVNFNPHNYTLDPFAAAFVARSLDWESGKTRVFDTYNGKSRYVISLTAIGKTTIKANGKKRKVWKISPKVQKIGSKKQAKLRDAIIYITDDEKREVLRIDSEVFVGTVKTKLVDFKPFKNGNDLTSLARINDNSNTKS